MARRSSSGSVGQTLSHDFSTRNGPILNTSASSSARLAPARSNTSQKLDSLVNPNGDPDDVFTRHTIAEVKAVQQRLRADADAKQEDLRVMVGERYRDLLQSSTSILSLAKSSKNVLETLGVMRNIVDVIAPAVPPNRISTREDKHLQVLQSLGAHVKLLLDAPEHLWRMMEKKMYLNAAWLYLLARVVHRALSQEDDDQSWQAYGIDVMDQFPLVQRQWDTITPFRSQISHRATLFLREALSTPGEVCATLLSLHLLESRPLPETLSIYLVQRAKTLSNILTRSTSTSASGDVKPNGKVLHRARRIVVRETKQRAEAALDAISRTVGTARATFADGASGSPSLMVQALHFFQSPLVNTTSLPLELRLTTQLLLEALPSASQLSLLPQSIRTYKPYIDGSSVATPALQLHLQEKSETWFNKAVQDAGGALADWFTALDSVQEVWEVRTTLLAWLKGTAGVAPFERDELESIVNMASQQRATSVWKSALSSLETSFQNVIFSAADTLKHVSDEYRHDIHPIEHLFQAPSIPSVLQSGSQGSVAAIQFAKYKASLRQQLAGRTPLLDSALAVLERHASDLQKDIATISKSGDAHSDLITRLSISYHADAERTCQNICNILVSTVTGEGSFSNSSSVFIGRICQELASSSDSDLFARLGCDLTTSDAFRKPLINLHITLMERWQEHTVSQILTLNFGEGSHMAGKDHSTDATDTWVPAQPSHSLIQALSSLSSEMQQLGVCLEEDRRQQQAGLTLRRFIVAYLDRLDSEPSPSMGNDGLQTVWDLAFLQRLENLWGDDAVGTSKRIDGGITRRRDVLADINIKAPPRTDIHSSVQEYLSRTQILLAGLLPSHAAKGNVATGPVKSGKPSSLLLYGMPAMDQRSESALDFLKTPPRFGLLLVSGATTVR